MYFQDVVLVPPLQSRTKSRGLLHQLQPNGELRILFVGVTRLAESPCSGHSEHQNGSLSFFRNTASIAVKLVNLGLLHMHVKQLILPNSLRFLFQGIFRLNDVLIKTEEKGVPFRKILHR
jgi:hypothetical protein